MQEIIHKVDNWSIIKLLGGTAIVIAGLLVWFGKIFFERLKHAWEANADKELEEIKGEVQKGNAMLNSLTVSYLNNFQKIQDKRIEAAEHIWCAILEIKNGMPTSVSLSLNILLDSELKKPVLDASKNNEQDSLGSLIQGLSEIDSTSYLKGIGNKVEKFKPFLGDEVFLLFSAYEGFIGRTVYQFINGYKNNTLRSWKDDPATVGILKPVIEAVALNDLLSKKVYSFNLVLYYLESKIITELRENLYGKNLSIDTVEYLRGIENILKAPKDSRTP